ncbi:transcription initiation factor Spt4 [Dictyostelium discoideum AX4]|uniref:Transcription initiation factor Spt4 n=1 Tax=Dictyostelium discoideum TaxID=44689 RepID=Q54NF2_DICDI|nr:transcription initiation factor Spt4 [Dictyostelium discoideum AX4]EAL64810.1 transcription initiation factor Spt4 [Dictyostelium discoideum AX4]|eukprot:XP_638317.1 transcription initiation factor Spt4 [Dictyostelium discoideum AX4]
MSKRSGRDESIVPSSFKHARACTECGLVKSAQQFEDNGCENCSSSSSSTTQNFEGIIAIMNPKESWIARRLQFERRVPGLYALSMDSDTRR